MNIVVTGTAGFIGSNIAKARNTPGENFCNLVDFLITHYVDKEEFLADQTHQ